MDPARFLEDLSGRHARHYTAAIHDLYVATVRGNRIAAFDARAQLARVIAETMGAAEVLGATLALRTVARSARFAVEQTILPRVTLAEALEDMVERTPVTLRNAAERTAQRIAELYTAGNVIAFVRAAEASVTKEAQSFIARAFREGVSEGEAGRRLAMSVNEIRRRSAAWSEGYARMVFRTNVNTAVTAGRFRQVQDPDVKAVVPAFRLDTAGDVSVRANHAAADGIILSVDSPRWAKIAPPLGYSCRCRLSHVTAVELEALGRLHNGKVLDSRIPSNAFPDPGFRHSGRPDLRGR